MDVVYLAQFLLQSLIISKHTEIWQQFLIDKALIGLV